MVLSPSTWLDYSLRRASVSHIFNPHYRPLLTVVALVYLLSAARTFAILFPSSTTGASTTTDGAISTTEQTATTTATTTMNPSLILSAFISILMIVAFVYVHGMQGMLVRRNAKDQAKWFTMGLIEGASRISRNVFSKPIMAFIIVSVIAEVGNITGSTFATLFLVGVIVAAWRLSVLPCGGSKAQC